MQLKDSVRKVASMSGSQRARLNNRRFKRVAKIHRPVPCYVQARINTHNAKYA